LIPPGVPGGTIAETPAVRASPAGALFFATGSPNVVRKRLSKSKLLVDASRRDGKPVKVTKRRYEHERQIEERE
jgi:hypothetical protein